MTVPTTVTLTIPDFADDADTLTVALQLAAAGIYVLPCVHGTKDPGSILGRNWQSKSSRDPEQIIAWFAGTHWELMIHCGRSGLIVVDVDTPDQLPELIGKHLPSAPFQSTRVDVPERGHAIFAMPPGRTFGNSLGRLPKGWGEIRGLNGVIKAFPSSHDTEGGRYLWDAPARSRSYPTRWPATSMTPARPTTPPPMPRCPSSSSSTSTKCGLVCWPV